MSQAQLEDLVDDLDSAEVVDDREPAPATKRRKSKTSPVQRTLKYLRKEGCQLVAIVEKWNPYMNGDRGGRQDLFGIIDVVATKDEQILAIQCCSTDVAGHIDKMVEATFKNPETKTECLVLAALFKANIKVFVHGWRKGSDGKYVLRQVELS